MTRQEAYDFFESLKFEATKISEIQVYNKFLGILTELKDRAFRKDEIESIESTLENFNLKSNGINNINFFKKVLSDFEKFLKDNFSLTPKDYYTNIGIALGASFGIVFGVAVLSGLERSLGLSLGIGVGLLIGLTIGRSMDNKAKNNGLMI
jgi:hypothetical protein